jgi:hypothetical protein
VVIDGDRYLRRLISLARWALPDVWDGFGGSLPTAKAVLGRWRSFLDRPVGSGRAGLAGVHVRQVGTARVVKSERAGV